MAVPKITTIVAVVMDKAIPKTGLAPLSYFLLSI
jgi:hypothetical protein